MIFLKQLRYLEFIINLCYSGVPASSSASYYRMILHASYSI